MDISKIWSFILISFLLTATFSAAVSAQEYPDAGTFAFLGAACLIWIVIWLIIWILVGIWVYKDAEKRGKSGVLWLIVVILLGLIGIIIWLLVRPPIGGEKAESGRRCPNCGRPIPFDARVCPYCGKKFEE